MKFPEIDHITFIGAGGTGSFLLQHLARFIKGHNLSVTVHIIDGDIIETERNLLRSPLLCINDMNKYKAETLAKRLNLLYGLKSFRFSNCFLETENFEDPVFLYETRLIITCSDSILLRKQISEFLINMYNDRNYDESDEEYIKFWLDCGNERDFGQVYLGYSDKNIPSAQWPNFCKLKESPRTRNGCSLQPFEKQGPVTNDRAAIGAMLLLEPLLLKSNYKYRAYYFGEYGSRLIKTVQEKKYEKLKRQIQI